MSVSLLPPDLRRSLADLARRVGILERRVVSAATSATATTHEILFSYAGELEESVSPPARVRRGGNLTALAVSLGTPGSTATVLDVLRNGTAVGTVTVPSGVEIYNGDVFARFAADSDTLAVEITAVGTGAADMTAEARFG